MMYQYEIIPLDSTFDNIHFFTWVGKLSEWVFWNAEHKPPDTRPGSDIFISENIGSTAGLAGCQYKYGQPIRLP